MQDHAQLTAQLTVLSLIERGISTNRAIAIALKKHQSTICRIANKSAKMGLIQKIGFPFVFELTGNGRAFLFRQRTSCAFPSLGVRQFKNVRFHSVVFKFPILRDSSEIEWDKVSEGFKNSVKKYKRIDFPIAVTIERTSKSVLLYLREKEIEKKLFLTDFFSWVFKATFFAYHYLNNRGLRFDFLAGEVLQQHVANPEPDLEKKVDSKITVESDLGRKASSVFPDEQLAKAWIDRSLGELEIETNDLLYEEKLLLMPEKIFSIEERQVVLEKSLDKYSGVVDSYSNSLMVYDANIKKHLAVLDKMEQNQSLQAEAMKELSETLKVIRDSIKGGGGVVGSGAGSKLDSSVGDSGKKTE